MARCAVPAAERWRQAAETEGPNPRLATRSALRFAPGGDIAARCPYLSRACQDAPALGQREKSRKRDFRRDAGNDAPEARAPRILSFRPGFRAFRG